MYEIYKLQNKINNKIYIGLTSRGFEKRLKEHIRNSDTSHYAIHQAIKKYGIDNFDSSVIDIAETEEEAKNKEIYYINQYNSYTTGYNETPGGDLNTQLKGENSPRHQITQEQLLELYHYLEFTDLTYSEIIKRLDLKIGEHQISVINSGEQWFQKDRIYPIRKNSKAISKQGDKNPSSNLSEKEVLEIIYKLANTKISQKQLSLEYNVHVNSINNINICKTWKHLHNYKSNIRKGI